MTHIWLLASAENGATGGEGEVIPMEETAQNEQAATQQEDGGNGTDKPTPTQHGFGAGNLIFLVGLVVIMYLLLFRGPKKKQQEHQKMVAALAKNDRVRTIGGIFGTVLDVRDDEIILKIDESTNTKMRISPSAVATVLRDTKNE